MTNKDKYLKDGVSPKAMWYEFKNWYNDTKCTCAYGEAIEIFMKDIAKPILTEDEKVILRHINTIIIDRIGRHDCGDLILLFKSGGFYLMTETFNFDGLFQFIKLRRRI